jgi:flagellar biosynthesis protein FlhF
MNPQTFKARSAFDAVAQIRAELGPEAVVLNVRPVPITGLARLWQKPEIEVVAHVPEKPQVLEDARANDALMGGTLDLVSNEAILPPLEPPTGLVPKPELRAPNLPAPAPADNTWQVRSLLQENGLLPVHAERVVEHAKALYGEAPPNSLAKEIDLTRGALWEIWNKSALTPVAASHTHVFIGPPGSGKTTCICKWLAQSVLIEGHAASVSRLDGLRANTAEALSVLCEALDVPVERCDSPMPDQPRGITFVDLPGIDPNDAEAARALTARLEQFPHAQVHLVLNAAYEAPTLLAQARAFAAFPIHDLMLTHLDEEPRWGKIWNLVMGTNVPVRFLSAGQNVPGEFFPATPERILARQFSRK